MVVIPSASELLTASGRSEVNPTWYRFFSDIPPVSIFMRTVLDDTTATEALATLGIVASNFLPTLTSVANLDNTTALTTFYTRVGALVTVFGAFQADATAAASTATTMGMSLPVASDFTGAGNLGGAANAGVVATPARVYADITNNRAEFTWLSGTTSNLNFSFIFGYAVI